MVGIKLKTIGLSISVTLGSDEQLRFLVVRMLVFLRSIHGTGVHQMTVVFA